MPDDPENAPFTAEQESRLQQMMREALEGSRRRDPVRSSPSAAAPVEGDRPLSQAQIEAIARSHVEEVLDDLGEREAVRRDREELKELREWRAAQEKGGKKRPPPGASPGPEQTPSTLTKAQRWLFGDEPAVRK